MIIFIHGWAQSGHAKYNQCRFEKIGLGGIGVFIIFVYYQIILN